MIGILHSYIQHSSQSGPFETNQNMSHLSSKLSSDSHLKSGVKAKIFTVTYKANFYKTYNCQRRQWHPTPVHLPGKSHGWRSLVGCSPWGRKESGMTERLHFHFSLPCIGDGNDNPLQCSCLENPRGGGAWWAAIYGFTQSRTRLKRLSIAQGQRLILSPNSLPQPSPAAQALQVCFSFTGFLAVSKTCQPHLWQDFALGSSLCLVCLSPRYTSGSSLTSSRPNVTFSVRFPPG